MRILSEEDRDEFVDVPYSTPTSPTKSKDWAEKSKCGVCKVVLGMVEIGICYGYGIV